MFDSDLPSTQDRTEEYRREVFQKLKVIQQATVSTQQAAWAIVGLLILVVWKLW